MIIQWRLHLCEQYVRVNSSLAVEKHSCRGKLLQKFASIWNGLIRTVVGWVELLLQLAILVKSQLVVGL